MMKYLLTSIFILLSIYIVAQESFSNQELGEVKWYRNYDKAISEGKKQNKDILLLFQEVPGCSTCRNYGQNVLSHPLMVEAIENFFIPVAVFNNKEGTDRVLLEKFNEPSWNNPVVRIINWKEEDVITRISDDYSAITLCKKMKESLLKKNVSIPEFLNLLEIELSTKNTKEEFFTMYCFWSGEKKLGNINGVISTESGFINHKEVVKVKYNTTIIKKDVLIFKAQQKGFSTIESKHYKVSRKDLHYFLQHSNLKYIPLTEIQKTKINSAIGEEMPYKFFLSPQQLIWLEEINSSMEKSTDLSEKDFTTAWKLKNT